MVTNSSHKGSKNFFAVFVNLLGVTSAFLYFTGWMYRLGYYGRFDISVIELNFGFESFLLLPIVIVFSDLVQLIISHNPYLLALIAISAIFTFLSLLRLLSLIKENIYDYIERRSQNSFLFKWFSESLNIASQYNVFQTIFMALLIFGLFFLAWVKGFEDGMRDISEEKTLLSKVKFVANQNNLPIAQGDIPALNNWRLLLRQEDWIYLVSCAKEIPSKTPLKVIMISKGDAGDKAILVEKPES